MSNLRERHHLRKDTQALIRSEGQPIALFRKGDFLRVPGGGVRRSEDPQKQQEVRRVFMPLAREVRITTANGEILTPTYVLIGKYDDDMQKLDSFTVGKETFEILDIDPVSREYQCKAWVQRRG